MNTSFARIRTFFLVALIVILVVMAVLALA